VAQKQLRKSGMYSKITLKLKVSSMAPFPRKKPGRERGARPGFLV
jgi:hypothetical protein